MSFIITSGLGGNKLITEGYGSGSSQTGGDSSSYYFRSKKLKRKSLLPLLFQVKQLLEAVKGEN